MVVDVNAHSKLSGEGEHLTRVHRASEKKDERYDAEAFKVEREFDIIIDDLTIESSKDKLNTKNKLKQ